MTNIVEQDVLKGISVKAKEYFNNDLEVPEAQRSRLPKGDLDPIGVNVMRTVDRQSQLSDDAFTRRYKGGRKESLEEARERLLHNADKRYDLKTIGKLSGNVCADGTRMDHLHDLTAMNKRRTNAEIAEIVKREDVLSTAVGNGIAIHQYSKVYNIPFNPTHSSIYAFRRH